MAGVTTEHKDYSKFKDKWQRARDVCAGQDAVHNAGPKYLPRLTDQTDQSYRAYVMRTAFVNFSWRTVAAMEGLLCRKAAKVTVPDEIKPLLDDIGQNGIPFAGFYQAVIDEVISAGRVGILADHPVMPENIGAMSKADAEAGGLRPKLTIYKAESIINWSYRNIGNKHVLARVVLKECVAVPDPQDEFCDKDVTQYRVLDLEPETNIYRLLVFIEENKGEVPKAASSTIVPLMNGKELNYIPFFCIGVLGVTTEVEEPPLIDLFDLNLSHYRTNADYEHGCHFTGLPTPYIAGDLSRPGGMGDTDLAPPKVYIGSESILMLDKDSTAGFMEFTGQGLNALIANKEAKEVQMAMLGSRLLSADKAGVEAFQTVAIRNNGETSILANISLSVSRGITSALEVVRDWAGASGDIEFQINRDFMSVTLDAPTLLALLAAVQAGTISKESFFDLLQRGDVVDQDLTFEEEQGRIDSQPPALPTPKTTPLTPRKPPSGQGRVAQT